MYVIHIISRPQRCQKDWLKKHKASELLAKLDQEKAACVRPSTPHKHEEVPDFLRIRLSEMKITTMNFVGSYCYVSTQFCICHKFDIAIYCLTKHIFCLDPQRLTDATLFPVVFDKMYLSLCVCFSHKRTANGHISLFCLVLKRPRYVVSLMRSDVEQYTNILLWFFAKVSRKVTQ